MNKKPEITTFYLPTDVSIKKEEVHEVKAEEVLSNCGASDWFMKILSILAGFGLGCLIGVTIKKLLLYLIKNE
jgi:hypothetical protein